MVITVNAEDSFCKLCDIHICVSTEHVQVSSL